MADQTCEGKSRDAAHAEVWDRASAWALLAIVELLKQLLDEVKKKPK